MWDFYKVDESIRIGGFYSMFEYGFDCGYVFPGEMHDFWECVAVLDGKIRVSGGEKIYELRENEMIFHKPMELHKFEVTGKAGAHLFIFSFSAEGELAEFFSGKAFRLFPEQSSILKSLCTYARSKCPLPRTDGEHDITMYLSPKENREVYFQMLSSLVCELFLSFSESNLMALTTDTPETATFRQAVEIMSSRLEDTLSVDEIARECNVSATQLKRIFRKYSDLGVHKYYLKMKINLASRLLREGVSVTDVSEWLGFSSQNYFSMVYKRETGRSPTEYKKG